MLHNLTNKEMAFRPRIISLYVIILFGYLTQVRSDTTPGISIDDESFDTTSYDQATSKLMTSSAPMTSSKAVTSADTEKVATLRVITTSVPSSENRISSRSTTATDVSSIARTSVAADTSVVAETSVVSFSSKQGDFSTSATTTVTPHPHSTRTITRHAGTHFDTQLCPFPQTLHIQDASYGYSNISCTFPVPGRGDYYTDIIDRCEGRLACDECEGLEAISTHDSQCSHINTDLVTLELTCKDTGASSWRQSISSIGDSFTDIGCPEAQSIYILHLFSGSDSKAHDDSDSKAHDDDSMAHDDHLSPFCLNVVKFRASTLYDGIVEDCQGLQECNNVLASPVDMMDYCGDKSLIPATYLVLVYECIDLTVDDMPSLCSSGPGLPWVIIIASVAAGVVVLLVIIIIPVICIRKKNVAQPKHSDSTTPLRLPKSITDVYLKGSPTAVSNFYETVPDRPLSMDSSDYDEITSGHITFSANTNLDPITESNVDDPDPADDDYLTAVNVRSLQQTIQNNLQPAGLQDQDEYLTVAGMHHLELTIKNNPGQDDPEDYNNSTDGGMTNQVLGAQNSQQQVNPDADDYLTAAQTHDWKPNVQNSLQPADYDEDDDVITDVNIHSQETAHSTMRSCEPEEHINVACMVKE